MSGLYFRHGIYSLQKKGGKAMGKSRTERAVEFDEIRDIMWEKYKHYRDTTLARDCAIFRWIAEDISEHFRSRCYYKEVNVRNFICQKRKGTKYDRNRFKRGRKEPTAPDGGVRRASTSGDGRIRLEGYDVQVHDKRYD